MPGLTRILLVGFLIATLVPCLPGVAGADPVTRFILEADSVVQAGGTLDGVLGEDEPLAGAAVGQLLDVAFEIETEEPEEAEENVVLAERLAAAVAEHRDDSILPELVRRHRARTPAEREALRGAAALEAEAKQAQSDGELDRAVDLLEQANGIYAEHGDRRSVAVNWGSQGVAHWYRADWKAVERCYRRALAERRAIEDRILEGRTLNGLGSVHLQTNRLEEALDFYQQAIEVRRATGDLAGLGTSLSYRGNAYLGLGRLVEARRSFEAAAPVLERVGDRLKMVQNLNGIANLHSEMGRTARAVETYQRALELCDEVDDLATVFQIRMNLASSLRSLGRHREALAQLAGVAALLSDIPDPGANYQLHREQGLTYLQLGELEEARAHLESARRFAGESGDDAAIAGSLTNLGTLALQEGRPEHSLELAEQGLVHAEGLDDRSYRRHLEALAGTARLALEENERALTHFERAEAIDVERGAVQRQAEDRAEIGNALSALGRDEDARRAYRASMRLLREADREADLWVPLLGMGDTFEESDPDSAVHWYERSLDRVESFALSVGGSIAQTGLLSTNRGEAYEEVARYFARQALTTGDPQWTGRAFRVAERAKGQGLRQLLETSLATTEDPRVEAVVDSLYVLESRGEVDTTTRARLLDRLETIRLELLRERGGAPSDLRAIDLPGLQEALDADTVALTYAVGDEASYLWVITSASARLVELPGRSQLRYEISRLRTALRAPGLGDQRLAQQARQLFETLVAPARAEVEAGREVLVVADDVLNELPFELLLYEDFDPATGWSRAPFVGRERAVFYAPSATVYARLSAEPARTEGGVFAVGDPDFSDLRPRSGSEVQLERLPQTRAEIDALRAVAGPRLHALVGEEATEAACKRILREERPALVHLATHGLVDRAEPSSSCVALGPGTDDGEDGYLHVLEILGQPLDADLVVLSACDTGRGKLERGEGVVGLTRAFLAGGARSVVASLWPVSDASTARLMERFYRSMLEDRTSAAESLLLARRQLMEDPESAHPWYWAAFVLVGSDRSVGAGAR